METALIIYLYFTLVSIFEVCLLISGLILGGFLVRGLAFSAVHDKWPEKDTAASKGIKWAGIPFIVIMLVGAFLPSITTIKYMIGGTAVMAASELDGIENLPQSIVDAANLFLEETKETDTSE